MNIITDYVLAEVATIGRLYQFSSEDAQDRLAKVELLIATSFFVTDSEKERLLSGLAQIRRTLYKAIFNQSKRSMTSKSIRVKSFEQICNKFNRSLTYKTKIIRRKIKRLKSGND